MEGSREHGIFFLTPDRFFVSPWHDVSLFPLYTAPRDDLGALYVRSMSTLTDFHAAIVNSICHMPMQCVTSVRSPLANIYISTSERYEVKLMHAHNPIGPILARPKIPMAKPNPACVIPCYVLRRLRIVQIHSLQRTAIQ